METTSTRKKRVILIGLAILVVVLAVMLTMCGLSKTAKAYEFSLNERDVAIEINDTVQLEVVPDNAKDKKLNVEVSWVSALPSVASVAEDGTVIGVAGGETKVTAVVKYGGKEYSASCIVTVKSSELEYSTYKVRWFTQKQDRSGYDVTEETFERLIGSNAELTTKEALQGLPANYVLNEEKSILSGMVQDSKGACVLEIYHDVAKITYSVDYYYESDTNLGTYDKKQTKHYKAYAFTEVQVTEAPERGFVINEKVRGTVVSNSSVVSGSRLKVYCDRARSEVTITYVSGKKTATYTCIYGIGLQNAAGSVLTDALTPYYVACYVNNEKIKSPEQYVKTIAEDTTLEFKVDGAGFEYSAKENVLVNVCEKSNTSSYVYLQGSGSTVYLSATYDTTGSKSNMFGITLRSGGTSREIRFQYQGVGVMKDHTSECGTLSKTNNIYAYNTAGAGGNTYVWAQNTNGINGMVKASVINEMLKYRWDASHDITWVVWEGVLYCNVDGETAIRLPLNLLNKSWTADKEYEIGFSTFDGLGADDELMIRDVTVSFDKEASAKLITDGEIEYTDKSRMDYEPITGSYMSASSAGAAYLYGDSTVGNSGISANVEWVNKENTNSAAGITIKMGDESVQYVIQGMNGQIRRQENHGWESVGYLTTQVMKLATPFEKNGTSKIQAFVKDGFFYITYNGIQAQCINMLSLFPEYTKDSEVALGIYTWDANNGLARFKNVKILSDKKITENNSKQWGYYSEAQSMDDYDFTTGTITKTTGGWKKTVLLGNAKAWQVEGTMKRPADDATELMMGFKISAGNESVQILGSWRGFRTIRNDSWDTSISPNINTYRTGTSLYAFGNQIQGFFGTSRNRDELPFKAVILDDILYVWFDGEISWRIPLTEAQFGGFEKGSSYNLDLIMSDNICTGEISDLQVKMGYQVTEQTEFIEYQDQIYSLQDTLQLVNDNLDKWNSFTFKHLTGVMAEEVESIDGLTTHDCPQALLKGAATDVYLSANSHTSPDTTEKKTFNFGITIIHGAQSRQLLFDNMGVKVYEDWTYKGSTGYVRYYGPGEYVWGSVATENTISKMIKAEASTYKIEWTITNGILYGAIEGEIFIQLPLTKIHSEWTADKEYQIGFAQWKPVAAKSGDVRYTDIVAIYGEQAKETNNNYVVASQTGASYLYGDAFNASTQQAIKVKISIDDKTTSYNGITLKAGNKSAQILVEGNDKLARVFFNHEWGLVTPMPLTDVLPNKTLDAYNDQYVSDVTAVVKNDMLYLLYNGTQVGSVELYTLLPGYDNTKDSIQLGVATWDSNNGNTKFTDIEFVQGEAVNGIKTTDYRWNINLLTSYQVNATVNRITGAVTHSAAQRTNNSDTKVFLQGASTTWEVTGKMKNNGTTGSGNTRTGFWITSENVAPNNVYPGSNSMAIMSAGTGFKLVSHGTTNWHSSGKDTFVKDTIIEDFFYARSGKSEIYFKAVISNDTLYVWLGYSEDSLVPAWKVGLTAVNSNNQVKFTAGTSYRFGIGGTENNKGDFYINSVKTGSAVDITSVSEFNN